MSTHPHDIAQLRKSYERAELDEAASHANPLHQFEQWLGEAIAALSASENPVPVKSVAVSDRYGQSGTPLELQEYYGLTFREIVGESAQVWSMRRR